MTRQRQVLFQPGSKHLPLLADSAFAVVGKMPGDLALSTAAQSAAELNRYGFGRAHSFATQQQIPFTCTKLPYRSAPSSDPSHPRLVPHQFAVANSRMDVVQMTEWKWYE